jgi:hypothetical protein
VAGIAAPAAVPGSALARSGTASGASLAWSASSMPSVPAAAVNRFRPAMTFSSTDA